MKYLIIYFYSILFLTSCSTWDTEIRLIIENKTELKLKKIKIQFCQSEQYISLSSFEKSKTINVACSGKKVSLFAKMMQPGPLPFYLEVIEIGDSIKVDPHISDLSSQINYDYLNNIKVILIENDSIAKNKILEFKLVSEK